MSEPSTRSGHLLSGAPAFRDLGGAQTADGLRQVRRGVVYRSCALLELTEEDVAILRDDLGIRTIVDLRDRDELGEDERVPWLDAGIDQRHIPLIDLMFVGDPRPDPSVSSELPLVARYLQYVEHGTPQLIALLGQLADVEAHPLVFHCTAGKDRTGLLAAVLLEVLGVDAETIAADYGASSGQGDWLRGFLARRPVQGRKLKSLDPRLLRSDPATMRALLEIVAERHGGFRKLLLDNGADPELFGKLEYALLEPVARG